MPPKFSIGETVSLEEWDQTVPPRQRIHKATIQDRKRAICQSGWLYLINGRWLDQAWLSKTEADP